jgi:uncharacterized membrane protein
MFRTAAPNDRPRHRHVLSVLLVLLGVLGYEGLAHWSAVSGGAPGAGPLFSFVPVLLLLCWIFWRQSRTGALAVLLAVVIALFTLLRARQSLPDLKLLYPVPHITVYVLLLWFFGRTLRAGREPLVTRIARHEHGTLPADIELYTRRVTWAWCVYFAVMASASLLLFAVAPLAVWSWFANVLNVPLILLMFLAEYAYRVLRFPNFSHASFFTAIRAFRDLGRAAVMQGR